MDSIQVDDWFGGRGGFFPQTGPVVQGYFKGYIPDTGFGVTPANAAAGELEVAIWRSGQ